MLVDKEHLMDVLNKFESMSFEEKHKNLISNAQQATNRVDNITESLGAYFSDKQNEEECWRRVQEFKSGYSYIFAIEDLKHLSEFDQPKIYLSEKESAYFNMIYEVVHPTPDAKPPSHEIDHVESTGCNLLFYFCLILFVSSVVYGITLIK